MRHQPAIRWARCEVCWAVHPGRLAEQLENLPDGRLACPECQRDLNLQETVAVWERANGTEVLALGEQ